MGWESQAGFGAVISARELPGAMRRYFIDKKKLHAVTMPREMGRFIVLLAVITGVLVAAPTSTGKASHSSDLCQAPDLSLDSEPGGGDGLTDFCDPSWLTMDADGDGSKDSLEVYLGTDPLTLCSHPNDVTGDGKMNTVDVARFVPKLNTELDDVLFDPRFDLTTSVFPFVEPDGRINTIDVMTIVPVLNHWCFGGGDPGYYIVPNPELTARPDLEAGTRHFHFAHEWASNAMRFRWIGDPASISPAGCLAFMLAGDLWSDGEFSIKPWDSSCLAAITNVEIRYSANLPPTSSARWVPFYQGNQCTDSNPCSFADFALLEVEEGRDLSDNYKLWAHEFGHGIGIGHPYDSAGFCGTWTIMNHEVNCWPVTSPEVNDVYFMHIKYQ